MPSPSRHDWRIHEIHGIDERAVLILWVVIELLNTEIKHMRDGGFAVIRKVLIASLQQGDYGAQWPLIASIATLGAVYWLIHKTESSGGSQ